jgi:hypothetical protein
MIIRVNKLRAELTAEYLDGAVSNDLISIHVALSTRTCLPDHKGEVLVELALGNFITSLNNSVSNLWLKSIMNVCLCCSFLEETKSTDNRDRHTFTLTTNFKVLERSLSLSAPVFVAWDLNRSESISFLTVLAWGKNTKAADLLGEAE